LAAPIAYLVEGGNDLIANISPEQMAAAAASVALGVKRALAAWQFTGARSSRQDEQESALEVVKKLAEYCKERGWPPVAPVLEDLLSVAVIRDYSAEEIEERVNAIFEKHGIAL